MSSFPETLPPRPGGGGVGGGGGGWKDRSCPNARGCWSFSWGAFSLRTSDKALLARRICMWVTLLARTAMSVVSVIRFFGSGQIAWGIVDCILGVLVFFFIAWCLAVIGEAKGRRKVLGLMLGRWHFDIVLLLFALAHVGLLVGSFFGITAVGLSATWILLWLLIFGVAWICQWPPEPESYA